MSKRNNNIRYLIGAIFIFLFCLNVKVIANIENDVQSFDPKYPYLVCYYCEPAPEQHGIEYSCPPGPVEYCPFTLPCMYVAC